MDTATKVESPLAPITSYYVDEAGDGVLFGPKGRSRLNDPGASRYFMLGMVHCVDDNAATTTLEDLRAALRAHPLYASIPSMQAVEKKTARAFHAKDDHAEIRAAVFEKLLTLDFKFYAVIKDLRAVQRYVASRNRMDSTYRYQPNELYDLTVRLLFKQRLHRSDRYRIFFARRGHSDRTAALKEQLERSRHHFLQEHELVHNPELIIQPAYPWEQTCLQIADYCLWALQRCYERHEARFLHAIWPKVSLIHDVDDPAEKRYGTYWTRQGPLPDPETIKNRQI